MRELVLLMLSNQQLQQIEELCDGTAWQPSAEREGRGVCVRVLVLLHNQQL
jgi:hypothetical protein